MSSKELKRVKVLERVLSLAMSNEEGAITLGVSLRQLIEIKEEIHSGGREGFNPRKHGQDAQVRNNSGKVSASNSPIHGEILWQ